MIDSLEMADHGARAHRCALPRHGRERALVWTHGTDTMVETAAALAQARLADKTIVLTGRDGFRIAFGSSDGPLQSRQRAVLRCRCCRPESTSR
jgi:hypothetical protein